MELEVRFKPSERALSTLNQEPAWDLMQKVKQKPKYDAVNRPDGLIDLSGALNTLMTGWVDEHLQLSRFLPSSASETLSYGPLKGSPGLLDAAAKFFNRHFLSSPTNGLIKADHILASNGVTSLIDMVAWTLCDQGDAVLYFTPSFYMLDFDLTARAAVLPVPISTAGIDDPFGDSAIPFLTDRLDLALQDTHNRGIRWSALFVCNPANPQGRCYSAQTLRALALWCAARGVHLISDEIYALSNFGDDDNTSPSMPPFTSALNLQSDERAEKNVHVLYSLSKDFNMGGLRMDFFVTRNSAVRDAASRVCWFTWTPTLSDHVATGILQQPQLVQDYLVQYRQRLREAYTSATRALEQCQIPFTRENAGLFVFIDLSQWIVCFDGSGQATTAEQKLSNWLIEHGVFLNAGEFAGSEKPGQFRLVFTRDRNVVETAIKRIRNAVDKLSQ